MPPQVVGLTAKCGESSTAATQLQVVKALLTYVTGKRWQALRADASFSPSSAPDPANLLCLTSAPALRPGS